MEESHELTDFPQAVLSQVLNRTFWVQDHVSQIIAKAPPTTIDVKRKASRLLSTVQATYQRAVVTNGAYPLLHDFEGTITFCYKIAYFSIAQRIQNAEYCN